MAILRFWLLMLASVFLLVFVAFPAIVVGWFLLWIFSYHDFFHYVVKYGVRFWVWLSGARLRISGREHLDPQQAYLFVSNHQSNVDPPLQYAYLGHQVGVLAKKEIFKLPIFKQGLPLLHVLPVDRSNREAAVASTHLGAQKMRDGYSLLVYPEGTRSVDGKLKEFKKGVFYMALEAGVPIAPVVLNDTRLVWRKGEMKCHGHDVEMMILPPVSTAGYTEENVAELIARIRQMMLPLVKTD